MRRTRAEVRRCAGASNGSYAVFVGNSQVTPVFAGNFAPNSCVDALDAALEAAYNEGRKNPERWAWGVLVRKASCWIGVHYSDYNKRWCINLIPFVTVWVCKPGGKAP